jgi:hypothetical protein
MLLAEFGRFDTLVPNEIAQQCDLISGGPARPRALCDVRVSAETCSPRYPIYQPTYCAREFMNSCLHQTTSKLLTELTGSDES